MSNNNAYILTLCNQLAEQGKTPSVALIRHQADRPLPIPEVIQALKKWKENPDSMPEPLNKQEESQSATSLEQRVAVLEEQVKTLQAMIQNMTR